MGISLVNAIRFVTASIRYVPYQMRFLSGIVGARTSACRARRQSPG